MGNEVFPKRKGHAMKKLFCLMLAGTLAALASLPAYAGAPEAVYAARTEHEGETPASMLYAFADGTYKEYILQNDVTVGLSGGEDPTEHGYIKVYPQEGSRMVPVEKIIYTIDEGVREYFDEGVDTPITITGYTKYSGAPEDYFLSPGDKVAVISPSGLPGREQTDLTLEGLRAWGFEPVEGKHVCPETRTLEDCLEDLRWALEDPEIKAIFCVRGGYGATEVLDAIEEGLIAGAEKPIIGYSDITAYQGAWTCAGLPSIHASMSAAFDKFPEACAEAQRHMMTGEIPGYRCEAKPGCKTGTAEGILIGGNLSTFTACLDTAYDCTKLDQPYILFLEEVGENMQHIHRYLTILKHRGVLDRAAGIIFGEWTGLPTDGMGNYGEARGGLFRSVADMIERQFLDGLDVPVIFGFPSGHGETNYPLLMGATARMEVLEQSCSLSWSQADTEQDTQERTE